MTLKNIYSTDRYTEFTALDLFLEEILGLKTNGFFLEIGAFDGETNSKTAQLADIGWEGLYVEPIKEYAEKCANRHKNNNVKVLNVAIGDKDGQQKMHKGGLPSTLKQENMDHLEHYLNEQGSSFGFEEEAVQVYSWQSFRQFLPEQLPDIMVLDAEGFDLQILQNIDFNSFRPNIICTEVFPEQTSFMPDKVIHEGTQILELLIKENYHIWIREEHNVLFVDGRALPLTVEDCLKNNEASYFYRAGTLLTAKQPEKIRDNLREEGGIAFFGQLLRTSLMQKNRKAIHFLASIIEKLSLEIPDPETFQLIAESYLFDENWIQLIDLCHLVLETHGWSNTMIDLLVLAYVNNHQEEEALKLLEQSLQHYPLNNFWKQQRDLLNQATGHSI